MTVFLDLLYTIFMLLIWVILIYVSIQTVAELYREHAALGRRVPDLLWRNKLRLATLGVSIVVAMMATTKITAYLPKTTPESKNSALEEKLKQVEDAKPIVKPSTPDRKSWEEIQQKNREENEKVKEEFRKLPSQPSQ